MKKLTMICMSALLMLAVSGTALIAASIILLIIAISLIRLQVIRLLSKTRGYEFKKSRRPKRSIGINDETVTFPLCVPSMPFKSNGTETV